MDKAQFWQLIEESRQKSEQCLEQADELKALLLKLEPNDIIAFSNIFDELTTLAYRWDLWGAAHLINGGASDDSFTYFRWWLIGRGQKVFEAALQNPDSLAEIVEPDEEEAECEQIAYCINDAYKEKAGNYIPEEAQTVLHPREPVGTPWEEDDELDALFPRLTAKFTSSEDTIPFWPLLEDTYEDDTEEHAQNLKAALKELSPEEILAFHNIFHEHDVSLYSWELWAVAYLVNGGCSDDCFTDFRSMIIRRGRLIYNMALLAPEDAGLMFDLSEENWGGMFTFAIVEAYEEVAGAEFPESAFGKLPAEPAGTRWEEDDLEELFPRLWRKFG